MENIKNTDSHSELVNFIHNSIELRPPGLFLSDLKWKFLIRSVLRGQNILLTGHAGCGKTVSAFSLKHAFPTRHFFYTNLGSTQDPRSSLIGNTHLNKDTGTYFAESLFVKAIQIENAIILLDEISRAHPEAWNILISVLDQKQRYLRLDEKNDCQTINVASGVTFVSTANIGFEYTATRILDRALKDRFEIIEVDLLTEEEEYNLLKYTYPTVNLEDLKFIANIADKTRKLASADSAKLSTIISTRMSLAMASLLADGFELEDAASITILPFFSPEGGANSERTIVKQMIQKYIKLPEFNDVARVSLFSNDEIRKSTKKHNSGNPPF